MTYLDLIRDADRQLDDGRITIGEYEQMIEPMNREVQPTVEPEQKHNRPHWVISSDGYYPYCSECKSEPKSGDMTNFCPSCGADMRGGIDGGSGI